MTDPDDFGGMPEAFDEMMERLMARVRRMEARVAQTDANQSALVERMQDLEERLEQAEAELAAMRDAFGPKGGRVLARLCAFDDDLEVIRTWLIRVDAYSPAAADEVLELRLLNRRLVNRIASLEQKDQTPD